MHRTLGSILFALATLAGSPALADRDCEPFESLALALEQNATDGDSEVALLAKTEEEGLRRLTLTNPRGRTLRFQASAKGIGIREFVLESAEPSDLSEVLASFPAGDYAFRGVTVTGECVAGVAPLSHTVAPPTTLLSPAEDEVVELDDLVLAWTAVAGADHYVVELNNEDTGVSLALGNLSPETTSLAIPANLLAPDSAYQFQVAVVMPTGNLTTVELAFATAP
jgi:hypothetical protein